MGVAFTMISSSSWKTTTWGIKNHPTAYNKRAQMYCSIMTKETPMKVYRGRFYGLLFHITPRYDFWKFFQVIGKGAKAGNIVGGPGDGGSHTPRGTEHRRSPK